MYGFPTILSDKPQRLFFDENPTFGFPEGAAIFYSRKDGNWFDPSIWGAVNNAGRFGLPSANDIVYVRHNVNTISKLNSECLHLFISGELHISSYIYQGGLHLYGDIFLDGKLIISKDRYLYLYNTTRKSYLKNYKPTTGAIVYVSYMAYIIETEYYIISFSDVRNVMTLPFSLTVNTITVGANNVRLNYLQKNIDLNAFSFHDGVFTFKAGGTMNMGSISIGFNTLRLIADGPELSIINLTNGINAGGGGNTWSFIGNILLVFKTNNQSLTSNQGAQNIVGGAEVLIQGAITVTANNLKVTNRFNGSEAGSKFVVTNYLVYTYSEEIMKVGIADFSLANVNYRGYSQEIKGTTYYKLTFSGSGIKKLMGNVIVTDTYTLSDTATVDLNGFTLTTP